MDPPGPEHLSPGFAGALSEQMLRRRTKYLADERQPQWSHTEGFVLESVEIEPARNAEGRLRGERHADADPAAAAIAGQRQRAQDPHRVSLHDPRRVGRPYLVGHRRSRAISTTSRSGIRACVCTTICAAGIRCRTSAASFIWSTATLIITITLPSEDDGCGLRRTGEPGAGADAATEKALSRRRN